MSLSFPVPPPKRAAPKDDLLAIRCAACNEVLVIFLSGHIERSVTLHCLCGARREVRPSAAVAQAAQPCYTKDSR